MSAIIVDEDIKSALSSYSAEQGFFEGAAILSRGKMDEIVLLSQGEVKILVAIVDHYTAGISLKFPYYDKEHPFYNPSHDEKFDFANAIVATYLSHALGGFVPGQTEGKKT